MSGFYNLEHKEVIRIKVKKCDGKMQPEYKKFSIDPQITSFEMLQGILARAFDINSDFTISYLARDAEGQTVYLSMLSDWDMDAAFQCAADPCLKLKVDLRPFEEEMEDWDVIAPAEIPQHRISSLLDKNSLLGSITHNLGKTMSSMQRAIGLKNSEEDVKPIKPPMSDMEFHNYLDSAGFMVKPHEFRLSIYQGGIEPSLRRVAWRHLLNIFPANMTGKDRFEYMKRKEEEYRELREEWKEKFRTNTTTEEVKYVTSMVKKDVLRTDRTHGFYAGNDENENTLSLFHILVTYALTHPDVSYCQGMSDLASPILVTQKNEAQAYVCFCALMNRLRVNFTIDGSAIMTKFKHLSELLLMYDPDLYKCLNESSGGDMFFCYRWFLLELKREFPFTDALHVLEVMWATLPPSPPINDLPLVDSDYSSRLLSSSPCSPSFSFQQAMYAKLLAMRRVGAMQRVSQAAINISKNCHSANNNLSGEKSFATEEIVTSSIVSSFDTSPGDNEDRQTEFPVLDSPLFRSVQKKSESIDQVLHENETLPELTKDADTTPNSPPQRVNNEKEEEPISNDTEPLEEAPGIEIVAPRKSVSEERESDEVLNNQVDTNESNVFQFSDEPENLSERGPRSWSVSSSNSQTSEAEQPQFTLSLDANTNSNNSAPETDDNVAVPGTKNIEDIPQPSANASDQQTETPGLFQSMKRLLSSPKRKPGVAQRVWSESNVLIGKQGSIQHSSSTPTISNRMVDKTRDRKLSSTLNSSESDSQTPECNSNLNKTNPIRDPGKLAAPQEFGGGNPFLMFLCFSLLIQHRQHIIEGNLCYEEIAMYFDRLVRRHNASRVLNSARNLYTEYLRCQQANLDKQKEKSLGSSC